MGRITLTFKDGETLKNITQEGDAEFVVLKHINKEIIVEIGVKDVRAIIRYEPSDPTFSFIQNTLNL